MLKIDFHWIEECESTSRMLKEQGWPSGDRGSVIAAGRQSGGVGRLGRSWISLPGNLHFSIALPEQFLTDDLKEVIPLAAGVLVAEFLRIETGLNICLKWPNDLILDGRKIGGILCESSIFDGRMQGVIIGIGINLKNAPEFDQALKYPAGSLATALTARLGNAKSVAQSLSDWFASRWPSLTKANVVEKWKFFSIGLGHSWYREVDAHCEWYSMDGIDNQGHLALRARDDGQIQIVSSISHELRWDILMGKKIFVSDVGNTRTKLGLVSLGDDGTVVVDTIAANDVTLESFVTEKLRDGVSPVVHCLSVNPMGFKALEDQLRELSVSVRAIEKKPVRLTNSKYDLNALGIDRWAILEMLYFRRSLGVFNWPALVVSCGTATTIDCVDQHGCHVGGYILAGVQTSLDALSARGALLPKSIDFQSMTTSHEWPTSSQEAMAEAALRSTTSLINSERERLARLANKVPTDVTVILTGGLSALVRSRMTDSNVFLDENFVLLAAGLMVANGR